MSDASNPDGGPGSADDPKPADDPILARRRRIESLTRSGQRLGYACYGVAVVAFLVGFVAGYSSGLVSGIVALLIVGSAVLAPSIVLSFAVRAADRADRENDWW